MGKSAGENLVSKLDGALSTQVAKVTDGHNRLATSAEELRSAVDEYVKRVVAERVSAVSLAEETRGYFSKLQQRLAEKSQSESQANERLTQAEKALAGRTDEIAALKERISLFERTAAEHADAQQAAHARIEELQREVEEAEKLKRRIVELETDLTDLQEASNELKLARNRIQQLEDSTRDLEGKVESHAQAEREIEELKQLVKNERQVFEENQAATAKDQEKKIADLEALLKTERESFEHARNQATEASQKRTLELEGLLKKEHDAARSARAQVNELQSTIEQLTHARKSSAEAASGKSDAAQQEAVQRISHLERELADAKESRDEAREATQKMLRAQQSGAEDSSAVAQKLDAAIAEHQRVQSQLDELVRQNEELRETNVSLRDQIKSVHGDSAEKAELETAITTLRAQMDDELARERQARESLERDTKDLRFKWEAERDRADEAVSKLERELSNGTKSSLAKQLSESLDDYEHAREELARVRRELDALRDKQTKAEHAPRPEMPAASQPAPPGSAAAAVLESEPAQPLQPDSGSEKALVESGILTRDQLQTVKDEQEKHPDKTLLRLIVDLGFAEEKAVRAVLGNSSAPAPASSTPVDQRIGQILLEAGALTHEQLNSALHIQARQPARTLGSILVDEGFTTDEVVVHALNLQDSRKKDRFEGNTKDGRRRVGKILVDAGIVTEEQLEVALLEQKGTPDRRLGAILVDKGYTTEDLVAQALGFQRGVDFVRIVPESVEQDVVKLVNARLAEHHCCMPLRREENRLVLAMVNPLDLVAIEDIERASELSVEPVVATATDIHDSIRQYYY